MHQQDERFNENSDAVQAHLNISQSVIQRMASNSASSKGWAIALVSAVLVIVADKNNPDYALIAVIPIVLFLSLDAYYLSLEKRFRNSYNLFIDKLHDEGISASDLYAVEPCGKPIDYLGKAVLSFSIWPFYLMLLVMVLIARIYVL